MNKNKMMDVKIIATSLEKFDKGCMTYFLHVEFDNENTQGYGGNKASMCDIERILEVIGVERWEHLIGKPCRVVGDRGKLTSIGHAIENKWHYIGLWIGEKEPKGPDILPCFSCKCGEIDLKCGWGHCGDFDWRGLEWVEAVCS
ncbi:hypothetical protein LCGC14_2856720, partial [marine sediment metagenome]